MTKTDLAALIGATVQTVSKYERGDSVPPPDRVAALSEALTMPTAFFFDASMPESIAEEGASFRALSKMSARQRHSAVAASAFCVRLNTWLEEHFELPSHDLPDSEISDFHPAAAATTLRSRWKLGNHPISNLLHTVEKHGVRVFALPGPCREVDAFSFWHERTPFVCLGTHKTPERAVFDLAHELGHLVLHQEHIEPRGRQAETEANLFASNFLMPADDLTTHVPRFPTLDVLVEAKTRWRVSVAALNYRLHQLGLVSEWHYREMCINIAQYGRTREPNSLRRDHSYILTNAFAEMRNEGITRADIARQLNFSLDDLNQLLDGLTVTVIEGQAATRRDGGGDRRGHLALVE